jgi:hypothetical protein
MNSDGNQQPLSPHSSNKRRWALVFVLMACIVPMAWGVFQLRSQLRRSNSHMKTGKHPIDVKLATPAEMNDKQSHTKMLAVLHQIDKEKAQLPLLGTAKLNSYQQQLANWVGPIPPSAEFTLRHEIASGLLEQGRTEEAIHELKLAFQLLSKIQVDASEARILFYKMATAQLRLGETENCVNCKTHDSCLLPIRGGGIHKKRQGSEEAIRILTVMLNEWPDDTGAAWLLNLAHMTLGTYPDQVPPNVRIDPKKFESDENIPQFVDVAAAAGLNLMSLSGGAIVDDFDNDGWLDIVTSEWDSSGQLIYFRNLGNGKFEQATERANLTGLLGGLNLNQADYDNDGDIDILVLRGAWLGELGRQPNSLLRNDGRGKFTDVTFAAGLGDVSAPTQTAAWDDFDLDGDLDLYIGNEEDPSQLFENLGNGQFIDVANRANVTNLRFAKGVVWGDYNNDRWPDLYVSNLGQPNRLYHNNGDGTFRDVAIDLGVEKPDYGFPTWFWDFNNDGNLDLLASSYEAQMRHVGANYLDRPEPTGPDRLYQGDGQGGFTEVGKSMGLTLATLPMGSNFGDFNYDGYPDFYLGTGRPSFATLVPNLLFMNNRGKGFLNVTTGANVGHLQKGHGVGFADIDHDGDQDIFIEMGGAYPGDAFENALFENPGFGNHWIVVKLEGVQSNRSGVGARIRVEFTEDGQQRSVYKWCGSGGSFGANPLRQEIGVGKADQIDRMEVYWPVTDKTQVFQDLQVDQALLITEDQPNPEPLRWESFPFQHSDIAE